ncbi:hypothetical protein CAPTEDRAFT_210899 [Capitella teleta]|uniref:Reelin domain-containing protein n=1 Tax=Capitella teleta TaxID=283909 RepID=R7V6F2_CAPTE|nr:hypothetical protein CAPTEDRAFT_210899 [Capitella teleta]|eukprot:ELU14443.1 hypothetical protein CAPTEDRAFT_210899 [Capitella teleta]
MKIFAFLILVLFADFAMGDDIHMCPVTAEAESSPVTPFANDDSFYFGVKTCNEMKLYIGFPDYLDSLIFKIGRTFQLTNNNGQVLAKSNQVVLDCNEMNYYWLNRINSVLTIGRGLQSGTDPLITYSNPLPDGFNWRGVFFANVGRGAGEFEERCVSSPDSVYSINLETTNESDSFPVNNNIVASSNAVIYTQTSQNTSNNQEKEQGSL